MDGPDNTLSSHYSIAETPGSNFGMESTWSWQQMLAIIDIHTLSLASGRGDSTTKQHATGHGATCPSNSLDLECYIGGTTSGDLRRLKLDLSLLGTDAGCGRHIR